MTIIDTIDGISIEPNDYIEFDGDHIEVFDVIDGGHCVYVHGYSTILGDTVDVEIAAFSRVNLITEDDD